MGKILITGASGFIGSNLTLHLCNAGYKVIAIVRDAKKVVDKYTGYSNLTIIECDMSDYALLSKHIAINEVDIVFHLAWAGVSDPNYQNYSNQIENIKASCELMELCVNKKIRRFLFAGSLMEYEHQKAFSEQYFKVSMRNIYHVAKHTARNMLQIIANNNDIEFVPLTISNVYGVGEISPRLINTALRALIEKKHMSFTSADQMYDFLYIDDAVEAIKTVAEKGLPNTNYYIGSSTPRKLKEYLIEMRDTVDPNLKLGIGEVAFKGITLEYNEMDTLSIYRDLGFKENYSFREGIKKTVDWMIESNHSLV